MVSYKDIIDSVKASLEEQFPGETVYTNVCPQKFERPSSFVELGTVSLTDASCGSLEVSLSVKIRSVVDVDARHNSQAEELLLRLAEIHALFCGKSLKVGDRSLHITAVQGEVPGLDYAQSTVRISYMDEKPTTETEQPTFRQLHLMIK